MHLMLNNQFFMKKAIKLLVPILFISFFACDDELVELVVANEEDVIQVDSEMFNLISRVAGADSEAPEITCISFVYSFTIFTYDEDLMFINSQEISGDAEFSEFLTDLDSNHFISLSLPITATLDNGDTFSISSYEELQESVEACVENDFLQYCNATLPTEASLCIWDVSSPTPSGSAYDDSFFTMNNDGSMTFNHEGDEYTGTWITLIIENEVHLNINLEGTSEVALDWNYDWKITLTANGNFQLVNEDSTNTFILEKICEENCSDLLFEECETNPSSGIAVFDLDSYTSCVLLQSNITDPAAVTVTYHLTQADSEANTNAIVGIYTNTNNPQTIYVRIEDNMTGEATYVSITIEAIAC